MLEWTGERFIPGEGGIQLHYEHSHRYELARMHVVDRRVLDYGSGEGYGSRLLARASESVVGVDVDPIAVAHAVEKYSGVPNLSFLQLDSHKLPYPEGHFDVITCFEVIEHVPNPEEVLAELDRLLAPDGLLLISTPNKAEYSDKHDYKNEYHIREFYVDEFRRFLRSRFGNIQLLGQRLIFTSVIFEMDQQEASLAILNETAGSGPTFIPSPPVYVIAACRRKPAGLVTSTVLITDDDALSDEALRSVPRSVVDKVLADMTEERSVVRQQLDNDAALIVAFQGRIAQLEQQLSERRQRATACFTLRRFLRALRRFPSLKLFNRRNRLQ